MKKALILLSGLLSAMSLAAQNPWLHVYATDDKESVSMPFAGSKITFLKTGNYISKIVVSGQYDAGIEVDYIDNWVVGPNVPRLIVNTTPEISDIRDKTTLYDAVITLDGDGITPDLEATAGTFRGRGNSTLNYTKKPYNIKFPEKTKLYEFRKAKSYVLLANYIDPSYMRNYAAFSCANLIDLPYSNSVKVVDVVLNGLEKGSYMLTQKVGFNNGSVDLSKEDEPNSVMIEVDICDTQAGIVGDFSSFSPCYSMPYQLKDPDAPTDPVEAQKWWYDWATDFEEFETAVYTGQDPANYVDYHQLAKYLMVYNLSCNQELNHPKSVFLWKTKGGKWNFGPCWDFDWAFGYEQTYHSYIEDEASEKEKKEYEDAYNYFFNKYGRRGTGVETYGGRELYWYRGQLYIIDDGYYIPWNPGQASEGPSYTSPLLATGQNYNGGGYGGNYGGGGEFFLGIIKDNKEFLQAYAEEWAAFEAKLPQFWHDFDAYAATLKPSGTRDTSVWNRNRTQTHDASVKELKTWLKNRIDFISKPENNYGLY